MFPATMFLHYREDCMPQVMRDPITFSRFLCLWKSCWSCHNCCLLNSGIVRTFSKSCEHIRFCRTSVFFFCFLFFFLFCFLLLLLLENLNRSFPGRGDYHFWQINLLKSVSVILPAELKSNSKYLEVFFVMQNTQRHCSANGKWQFVVIKINAFLFSAFLFLVQWNQKVTFIQCDKSVGDSCVFAEEWVRVWRELV